MDEMNTNNEVPSRIQICSLVDYRGDNDKAIADYDEAIRLNPNDADAYKYRGIAYWLKADYIHAIADFTSILRITPHDVVAQSNRGKAYINNGDYDLAIQDFNWIIDHSHKDASAYHDRGVAYYNKGDTEKAIEDLEMALRINPYDSNIKQKLEIIRKKHALAGSA